MSQRSSSKTRSPNVSEVSPVGTLSVSYSQHLTLFDSLEEATTREAGQRVGERWTMRTTSGARGGAGARRRSSMAQGRATRGAQGGALGGAFGRSLVTMRREKELRESDGVNESERVRAIFFLSRLLPHLHRIFSFVELLHSASFQPNTLKMKRSRSVLPNS
jgi:hypothetical protein